MIRFFSAFYKKYLATLSYFDAKHIAPTDEELGSDVSEAVKLKSFKELDDDATLLGDAYRGVGVLVAILTGLIIFSAIVPTAFGLDGISYWIFGITEVVAMLLVIALVFYATKTKLRSKWRNTRAEAEKLRYEKFSGLLEQAEAAPTPENIEAVRGETQSHLSGESCQITYNRNKAHVYHKVEVLSNKIGWAGFGLALIGAVSHLVLHWNSLLILTVFVPAMVGAIHGLNSFLKLSDLIDDHTKVAQQLEQHKQSLDKGGDPDKLLETARKIYTTLLARDEQWKEMVERQTIHLG